MYLLNTISVSWAIVATAPELCQECYFFMKQWVKEISAYHVLEFMITSAKTQGDSTFMREIFENWG